MALHFTTADPLIYWPWNTNIDETAKQHIDCETATKYMAKRFVNLDEFMVEFMQ